MAVRVEELHRRAEGAEIVLFPAERVRRRAAASRRAEIRRRRAALGLLPFLVAAFLLASGPEGSAVASRPGSPAAVVLRPGQTMWDVAERYSPASIDTRAYVDALIEVNNLDGAPAAGQRIELPGGP